MSFIAIASPVGLRGFTYPSTYSQRLCDDKCGREVNVGPKVQAELQKDPAGMVICYFCAQKRKIPIDLVQPLTISSGSTLDVQELRQHLKEIQIEKN